MKLQQILFLCSVHIAVLGSLAQTAQAQKTTSTDSLVSDTLEAVQIEAAKSQYSIDRAPFSYSLVQRSKATLGQTADISLAQLAREVPGIWINDRENFALGERITMRGIGWRSSFGVRGIQVVLDGIPLTMADGQAVTNIIDPGYVRRMEIIRGPSSLFWGNAGGGVLYLETTPNNNQDGYFNLGVQTGSFNTRRYETQIVQPLGKHFVTAYGSRQLTDGYREYSSAELNRAGLGGYFQFGSNLILNYHGAFLSMPFAEHPGSLTRTQAQNDPRQSNQSFEFEQSGKSVMQGQAGLGLTWAPFFGTFTLTGFGTIRDLENPLPFAYINVDRNALGGRFSYEFNKWGFKIQAGAESKYQGDSRLEYDNNNGEPGRIPIVEQTEEVFSRSAFGILNYEWKFINVTAGTRYNILDYDVVDQLTANQDNSGSRNFDALTPAAGIGFRWKGQYLYANFTTSFETPTTTELKNQPNGLPGFNQDIEPEQMEGIEVGLRGHFFDKTLTYDLVAFQQTIDNMLIPFQLPQSTRVYYRNAAQTEHKGAEASFRYQPLPELEVGGTLSLLDATFIKGLSSDSTQNYAGNNIPGISPLRGTAFVKTNISDIQLKFIYEHTDGYFVNSINSERNNGYDLFDLHISHTGMELSEYITLYPFLEIRNLSDVNYYGSVIVNASGDRFFEPSAGRHAMAGFTLEVD